MCDSAAVFHFQAIAPLLLLQMVWYVLSCLWDGAYKISFPANTKE